ncbi:MAG TPA: squalene/phytoene synthase family protein [Xanthobacteraceae bacterium]|nr:squalene/phytoene synthase family protein [Xanthobacteraceae bacterium]
MQDSFQYCQQLVREQDKDRFLSALFAPVSRRPALYALYAFDIEIARIGARVREPLAGEVRLQWWREVLGGGRSEEALANPVAAALIAARRTDELPAAPLLALLDARTFDLYAEPMQSLAALEQYAEGTAGIVMRMAARVLAGSDVPDMEKLAAHAATAVAIVTAIKRLPADAGRGKLYLPVDLLQRHGASVEDLFAGRFTPALRAAIDQLRGHAHAHCDAAKQLFVHAPDAVRPAFLAAMLTPLFLARMARRDFNPYRTSLEIPQWRRQWQLWRTAHANRAE